MKVAEYSKARGVTRIKNEESPLDLTLIMADEVFQSEAIGDA